MSMGLSDRTVLEALGPILVVELAYTPACSATSGSPGCSTPGQGHPASFAAPDVHEGAQGAVVPAIAVDWGEDEDWNMAASLFGSEDRLARALSSFRLENISATNNA